MIIFWIYLAKYIIRMTFTCFFPHFLIFFQCGLLTIFNLHEQITLYFCWTVGVQRPSQSRYSHTSGGWWGSVLWGPDLMIPFIPPSSLPSPQFLKPMLPASSWVESSHSVKAVLLHRVKTWVGSEGRTS